MSLVRLEGVSHYYGGDLIFGPIDQTIEHEDRIGLIGANGSGKSTLLKIISSQLKPNLGVVVKAQRIMVGYLPQEPHISVGTTAYEEVLSSLRYIKDIYSRLRLLEEQMGKTEDLDSVLDEYATLTAQFELQGGYEMDANVRGALLGLGIKEEDFMRDASTFSGGEKARVALAKLLVDPPDLLVLDEPTNHLDVEGMEWLEKFLLTFKGALIVVSHDRYFLDMVTNRIWELDTLKGCRFYRGNYSHAQWQKAEERARESKEYETQAKEVERLKAYIRRYKAGNRATMAKSREKRLARIQGAVKPPSDPKGVKISIAKAPKGSQEVVRLVDVSHSYFSNQVLKDINFSLYRGERLGLVGPNGSGKSTLLSILAGRLIPTRGKVYFGDTVETGYFSQQSEGLDPKMSVIEHFFDLGMNTQEARDYLARFQFRGEDVFQKVQTLSGGEKRRLMLAQILASPFNFLCLDEPTNHLDIWIRETLEEALTDYMGSLIIVSHDRYLLHKAVEKIIALDDQGRLQMFEGGFEEYRYYTQKQSQSTKAFVREKNKNQQIKQVNKKEEQNRFGINLQLTQIEKEIENLEEQKKALEERMVEPEFYRDIERANLVVEEYHQVTGRLEEAYRSWEEKAQK